MRSRFAALWAVAAFGTLLAGLAPSLFADANSEFESRREEERKNYETMISSMPVLNQKSISELLRVTMESKTLIVRTSLASSIGEGYMRVKIADMGISGLIRIQGGVPAAGGPLSVVPSVLQFNLTDYTKPGQITTLSVNTQQSYCSISKSSQFPGGGYRNISLMQQASPVSAGGGTIQLTVNEAGRDGSSPLNIDIQGPDFFSLIRAHPRECDDYIRPLLRELGQESVFAPDPLIAWQVFAELWKADPEISRQVQKLLPGLDLDDFRARAKALQALEKLGREGAAVLIHLDRTDLSPEQNARIDRALAPYAQLPPAEAQHLRSDLVFLLDCLYSDDLALRQVTLIRLREIADPALQFDPGATPQERAAAVAALRKRLVRGAK